MVQNICVCKALLAHYGSTYLTHAHSVSPAASVQDELLRHIATALRLYSKGAAEQVAVRECSSYLEFLAKHQLALRADDAQLRYVSTGTLFQRFETQDTAKVDAESLLQQVVQFLLSELHLPVEELRRLAVIAIQHPREYGCISLTAIWVGNRSEVGRPQVLPAVAELVCLPAAALAEACIANFSVGSKYEASRVAHCLPHARIGKACQALIPLAVVVGTDIKERMFCAVVPPNAAFGCWLLAVGRWLLDVGCWTLAVG